jgi:phosphoribosylglycinamide formyltransferase-1
MSSKLRIAILASGSGTNAEAIIKYFYNSKNIEVTCLGSNKKMAAALEKAARLNISTFYQSGKKEESREEFDLRLIKKLEIHRPDWIILAGYMRLLSPSFLKYFNYQVINIHPSLLPAFPGSNAYEQAFSARVSESGCTVHLVDEGMDTGRIIAQKSFPLYPNDTLNDFKERGLKIENEFYPEVLDKYLMQKIHI